MPNASVRSLSHITSADVPVVRSRLTFVELASTASLPNLLRADISSIIPKDTTKAGSRMETGQYAPIMTINDLAKSDQRGDTVRVDIQHELQGMPTVCCDPLEGREEERTWSSFEMKIGITRHGVRDQCVSQNNLRLGNEAFQLARPLLTRWMDRIKTERVIYQLAGARAHEYNPERQLLPLDGVAFRKAMINCLEAPSYCRHYYGGDATDFDGQYGDKLEKDDRFTLDTVTRFIAGMDESAHPLLPIKFGESGITAKYLMLLTPAQWADFRASADGKWYAQLQAFAAKAGAECGNHPAFSGDCLLWDGVLMRKYTMPVRFKPGHALLVSNDDDCASTHEARLAANADFCVDRAIILGGAALAEAFGSVQDAENKTFGKTNFAFWSGTFDGGEGRRVHIKALDGEKKIRFASRMGRVYDHGVAVLDTAVSCNSGKSC
ncbi:DUF4043 family protein [Thiolinea disciformis]|uniref:phage capsid family protein n=1 Tax=Thiolinea disciformis TaxID=125614 RepID=UPI00036E5784|nr:DUF4043 family protein [Thiolinea disciformis]